MILSMLRSPSAAQNEGKKLRSEFPEPGKGTLWFRLGKSGSDQQCIGQSPFPDPCLRGSFQPCKESNRRDGWQCSRGPFKISYWRCPQAASVTVEFPWGCCCSARRAETGVFTPDQTRRLTPNRFPLWTLRATMPSTDQIPRPRGKALILPAASLHVYLRCFFCRRLPSHLDCSCIHLAGLCLRLAMLPHHILLHHGHLCLPSSDFSSFNRPYATTIERG